MTIPFPHAVIEQSLLDWVDNEYEAEAAAQDVLTDLGIKGYSLIRTSVLEALTR